MASRDWRILAFGPTFQVHLPCQLGSKNLLKPDKFPLPIKSYPCKWMSANVSQTDRPPVTYDHKEYDRPRPTGKSLDQTRQSSLIGSTGQFTLSTGTFGMHPRKTPFKQGLQRDDPQSSSRFKTQFELALPRVADSRGKAAASPEKRRLGGITARSLSLLHGSTSAAGTSKAEARGPRSMRAASYLPSHSLIFSSTNNSPFARSWFCQKRTKNTRVELLCSVTTLFHFQWARAQRSGHL